MLRPFALLLALAAPAAAQPTPTPEMAVPGLPDIARVLPAPNSPTGAVIQ